MNDYEAREKRRNVIVGTFVLIAGCAFVWLIFKFGDLPVIVSGWRSFEVEVRFLRAQGAQESTSVQFCGYQVGRVTQIRPPEVLEDRNTGQLRHQSVVVLSIENKYADIPIDVDVKLIRRGLGSSYIELKPKRSEMKELAGPFLIDGTMLQGSTGVSSEFFPEETQEKLEHMITNLTHLVNNANDIIGDKDNKAKIKITLNNLSKASEQATHALKEFHGFLSSATDMSEELDTTMGHMRLILEKVNAGEGTAGRLLNDARLYEELLDNSHQFEVLLEDLRSFIIKSRDKGVPIKLK